VGVELTSIDFQEAIETPTKNKVLMYVDPPYFLPPKRKHYRHGLDHEDHVRLAETLKKTKHSFFLTYDDAEEIRSLYSWAYIYPLQFFYRVENSATQNGARKQGFELVITNYEVPGIEHI
jgi:DNA adenine methylase